MKDELIVIYRDEYLIAVNKPSGLLVHRSSIDRRETRFAVQMLRDQIGRRVYPAHRLDRGTSGVLLFALAPEVNAQLGAQFTAQKVEKRYLAIVRGYPDEAGRIDHALTRVVDEYDAPIGGPGAAQPAATGFRRLATVELPYRVDAYPTSRYALVELLPETGRRHQLRRHMKFISHPIIGDATYGKGRHNRLFQDLFGCRRLLLACTSVRLSHPVTGQPLELRAALTPDFSLVVDQLGWKRVMPPGD